MKVIKCEPDTAFRLGDVIKSISSRQLAGLKISGFGKPWNEKLLYTPKVNEEYVWQEELVRDFAMFWYSHARALKLIGHTGSGKTELAMQWHAAFNLPLIALNANPKTESGHLVGQFVVNSSGGMTFVEGPLIVAAKAGATLLIDEYNLADPGEMAGLNALLEGRPYVIPETQETVVPVNGFRVIVTMNPKTLGYRGRQLQDISNDDRFVDMFVDYMAEQSEMDLVSARLEKLYAMHPHKCDSQVLQNLAGMYVRSAREIRALYVGECDSEGAIPCTMSTRNLLRWVDWSEASRFFLQKETSAIHHGLLRVLTFRQNPPVREAIHQIVEATTGERLNSENDIQL